jgi:tRNA uridine 5-carbamoylmethylation protein Kti12
MSVVVVLSGLPGSGKSYLTKASKLGGKVFIYSTDDYIEQMAIQNSSTYTDSFELYIREATEFMNLELKKAIEANMTVIWDQTNTKAAKRRWILNQFPEHYVKHCFAIIPPRNDREWQLLTARILSRPGKHIPKYVIESMLEGYEEPSLDEGFDLVNIVSTSGRVVEMLKATPKA